jgi:hypothetical protein
MPNTTSQFNLAYIETTIPSGNTPASAGARDRSAGSRWHWPS